MKFLPSKRYSLLFLTSGLYLFVWIRLLFDDLNSALGYERFNSGRIQLVILILFVVEMMFVALLIADFETKIDILGIPVIKFVAVTSAVLLFVLIIGCLVTIYKEVLNYRNMEISIGDVLLIILLTLFIYLSFVFVQQQVNAMKLGSKADVTN